LALACSPTQGNALATLFLIELGPDTVQRLVAEVSDAHQSLAWSPDGRYMAYQVAVTVGDAPVSGQALWMHDIATGRQTQLDEARLFDFQPVWTLDNSAVVYVVGSWQHSTGPVVTYRAPLDGSGGVPWLPDVQALVPGPAGQWLSVREPRDRAGRGQVLLIVADGSVRPLALPLVEEEYPLGWLDGEPVVWLRTVTSLTSSLVLGEVWLAGAHPRRLLTDVPYGQTGAIAGERLLYAEQVDDPNLARPVWLADLMTSQKQQLGIQGRTPVAVRPARSLAAPAPGLPSTGAGGSQPEQARP
jgi:hypothetical protein